jgi:hypothetical protein
MAIAVTVRADNAIAVYDEDDPRCGVVIDSPLKAAILINELTKTVSGLHGQEAWKRARMRALAASLANSDERLN